MFSGAKKNKILIKKDCRIRTKKLHKMKLNIIFDFDFFDPENIKKLSFFGLILRFSNLNVLHKGFLMQDWVF